LKRLFPDYRRAEQQFYRETGIFPISHLLVIKSEVVQGRDDVALELLRTFRRARDEAFRRLEEMQVISLSWVSSLLEEQRALMGHDYWPYNVAANRHVLETLIGYAHQQGLIERRPSVEEFFVPATLDYPGA
jgi:4,5-dihydroxyphthalate decarboxylase